MTYCPYCGARTTGGRFCGSCGGELAQPQAAAQDGTTSEATTADASRDVPAATPVPSDGGSTWHDDSPPDAAPENADACASPYPARFTAAAADDDASWAPSFDDDHATHATTGGEAGGATAYPVYPSPEEGAWEEPHEASSRSRTPLILGLAGLLLAGAAVFAVTQLRDDPTTPATTGAATSSTTTSAPSATTPSTGAPTSAATTSSPATSASPTTSANVEVATAAADVDALLGRSAAQRKTLQRAMDRCSSDPAGAAVDLQLVLDGRQQLLEDARSAPFAPLPSGADLAMHLTSAWSHSVDADRHFLDAARSGDCSEDNPSYQLGIEASKRAQVSKGAFVELWESQVRRPLGLDTKRTKANI